MLPASGFAVWIHPRFESGGTSSTITANAFYVSHFDVFGLVGIDPIEKLPIGAAQPVIAHEFGHHLFHQGFTASDGDCDPDDTSPNAPGRFGSDIAASAFND